MKHFERIEQHVEISPMLAEIDAQPDAWEEQVGRQQRAPAQRETSSIPIRGLRKSKIRGRRRRDVCESRFTTLSRRFPEVVGFLERFAAEQEASLARAKLARLAQGLRVAPHVDRGDYYRRRDRYHVVLRSPKGSLLVAGDEQIRMQEGELWWFDNKAPHSATNDSDGPRIHLIFDLEPRLSENLRSPKPTPTGTESEQRELAELLRDSRERLAHHEAEIVQQAVRLYLAGRERPHSWQQLFEQNGFTPAEDAFQPLRSTIHLLSEDTEKAAVRRQARAMVWALERIEAGELLWSDVAQAIVREGGVKAVARAWKQQQSFDLEPARQA